MGFRYFSFILAKSNIMGLWYFSSFCGIRVLSTAIILGERRIGIGIGILHFTLARNAVMQSARHSAGEHSSPRSKM
jgi:hypothetical protein